MVEGQCANDGNVLGDLYEAGQMDPLPSCLEPLDCFTALSSVFGGSLACCGSLSVFTLILQRPVASVGLGAPNL